jgi:short-subunit dehydrogenase
VRKNSIKKVVVLGATSGIAQALLRMMARDGKEFLLIARSQERLDAVRSDLLARGAVSVLTFEADLIQAPQLVVQFATQCFQDFDTLLLTYGTLLDQLKCQTSPEYAVRELETNLVSAVALLTSFVPYFESRRSGTIAVITSVAGDRGRRSNYVYGAAKGGLGIFLQGLRSRLYPHAVRVLTIKPGPVFTAMTAGLPTLPFMAEPGSVAKDICGALEESGIDVIYIPRKWRWIMAAIRAVPEALFKRVSL